MNKAALRKTFLQQRKLIPADEARAAGERMTSFLFGSSFWKEAESVFCFISVEGEPDTTPIFLRAFADGKAVFVPRTGPERTLETVPVTLDEFDENAKALWPRSYGIPEPPATLPAAVAPRIDLSLIPSLAVDAAGFRLGHGGGYYDRFIMDRRSQPPSGLFAAIQFGVFFISEVLPREPYDMPVDILITENGIPTLSSAQTGGAAIL